MSFDALAWAAKQNTGSSGTKLVLLGLAECADRSRNLAFPSIAALVEFSALNRKSVIANLDRLEAAGFITDTGRKTGMTQQIKVYRLNLETVPKTEQFQKRNGTEISLNSPENGTRNKSEPITSEDKSSSDLADFIEAWNAVAVPRGAVRCNRLSPDRRRKLAPLLKRYPVEDLTEAIDAVGRSAFLTGKTPRKFRASITFLCSPEHVEKLLEGSYG